MKSQELLDTLITVVTRINGPQITEFNVQDRRPHDDPALWRRNGRATEDVQNRSHSEIEADIMRRSFQRISTRKSRLIARLCEQIASLEIQRSNMAVSGASDLSYYQQLLTVQILHQQGHTAQALMLARRILQRATGADDSTMALLAGDLIDQLCGQGTEPSRQLKFITQQRQWSDKDHRRRRRALLAEELLVGKRHRTDAAYVAELRQAEDELKVCVDRGLTASRDPVLKAIVTQRMLREGRNEEVAKSTASALSKLEKTRNRAPTWLEVWNLTAHLRALTGKGAFDAVIAISGRIDKNWLVRSHLSHDLLRLRLMAEMRLGNWNEAQSVLAEIDSLTDHQTDVVDIERRMVLAAYLHLAHELKLCPVHVTGMPKRFPSLIGSIDLITVDRKGLGALVLIHDVIRTFLRGEAEIAERMVLNLQVYASRNLRVSCSGALREFISFLRMLIVHGRAFVENHEQLHRFTSTITAECGAVSDQAICPLPLSQLMVALTVVETQRKG